MLNVVAVTWEWGEGGEENVSGKNKKPKSLNFTHQREKIVNVATWEWGEGGEENVNKKPKSLNFTH